MKTPLSYAAFLADPDALENLTREARRQRALVMYGFITGVFKAIFSSLQWILKRGATMKLEQGRGTVVRVLSGNVWLTQHKDNADYVMCAGDCMVLNGEGITLIHAFEHTALRFAVPGTAQRPAHVEVQLHGQVAAA